MLALILFLVIVRSLFKLVLTMYVLDLQNVRINKYVAWKIDCSRNGNQKNKNVQREEKKWLSDGAKGNQNLWIITTWLFLPSRIRYNRTYILCFHLFGKLVSENKPRLPVLKTDTHQINIVCGQPYTQIAG